MNPVNPLPAAVSLLVAVATSFLLGKRFGVPPQRGRYTSIDGLRGYLAFCVFLYHSCIWYFYTRTGIWNVPPSRLYTHLGETSVTLFFMITGFLFFSKLIDGRKKKIDWGEVYVSRFLRLAPLYLFAMFLLFLLVAYLSGGVLNQPIPQLVKTAACWLGFTIPGSPNINGIQYTSTIIGSVTWSLRYEWFFYFCLPLIGISVGVVPPLLYMAVGVTAVGLLAVCHQRVSIYHLMPFMGGMAAAVLAQFGGFRRIAVGAASSLIVIGCIVTTIIVYPSPYSAAPCLILFAAFSLTACGNNVFGLLDIPASHVLGEISYSMYLLHPILLFIVFRLILSTLAGAASPIVYWLLVVGITPVLVILCFITFRFIEHPAMQSRRPLMAWLNRVFSSCLPKGFHR